MTNRATGHKHRPPSGVSALGLRSDLRRRQKETRLRLAQLLAEGPPAGLARAEDLLVGLCAEDPDDERLWTAMFHIHDRTGSLLGLVSAIRRLRASLVEFGTDDDTDPDGVPLPSNLERLVAQIRGRIGHRTAEPAAGAD